MLETVHVFLDAEPFVGRNFSYTSRDLKALAVHSKEGTVSLHITDVTYRELQKKIKDRVREAKHVIEPLRSMKNPNAAILRNAGSAFSGMFHFAEAAVVADLISQLDDYVNEAEIEIVDTTGLLAAPVLEKYFDNYPPFEKRDEKKNEFPDAFCIEGISAWCKANQVRTYVVSADRGFRLGCASYDAILPVKSISDVTNLISDALPHQTDLARAWLHLYEDHIKRIVAREFESLGFVVVDQDGHVHGVQVDPDHIVLSELDFLFIDEGFADVSYTADIEFTAHLEYDDPDATFWVEGDKYVMDTIEVEIKRTEQVEVYVELNFNPALAVPESPTDHAPPPDEIIERVALDTTDVSIEAIPLETYR